MKVLQVERNVVQQNCDFYLYLADLTRNREEDVVSNRVRCHRRGLHIFFLSFLSSLLLDCSPQSQFFARE